MAPYDGLQPKITPLKHFSRQCKSFYVIDSPKLQHSPELKSLMGCAFIPDKDIEISSNGPVNCNYVPHNKLTITSPEEVENMRSKIKDRPQQ